MSDFLSLYAEKVVVDELHPGPQASVDWFLPANVELVMNAAASHPFVGSFLGVVSAHLTSEFARECLKKVTEKFGEAIISKSADALWDRVIEVFRRSKEHNVTFSNQVRETPAPPLRLTLGVPKLGTLDPVQLRLVFPTDLSDEDLSSAYHSVGKVIERVMKTLEERRTNEQGMAELLAEGDSEKIAKLRDTTFTYVYRGAEQAWVNARVLAIQHILESRLTILRESLAEPFDTTHEGINECIADIQRQIQDARVH